MSVTEDFVVKNGLVVQGTAVVTTSTGVDGSLHSLAGIATEKNLIVGTTATVWGNTNLLGQLAVSNNTTLTGTLYVGGNTTLNTGLTVGGIATVTNKLVVIGITTLSGTLYVTSATTLNSTLYVTSTATLNTDLVVTGNSTLTGTLYVGNNVNLNGQLAVTGTGTFTGALYVGGATKLNTTLTITGITTLLDATGGGNGIGALVLAQGGMSVAGVTYIANTTTANTNGTAALYISGGVYVGDNLIVNSTAYNIATNTANSIYVKGGMWVDKTLVVSGDTTFRGSVSFLGTATNVFSTNTVYTDNLINLHVPVGSTGTDHTWAFDDGQDIGHVYHYYKGSDKNAFLGFHNETSYLEWYSNGTEETTGTFVGTTYGTFKTGSIKLNNTTASSNTYSGALTVEGGVGIGGKLYVGGGIDGTITTSTNIAGGSQGRIPIQSASGKTAFIPAGTGDFQVLTWNGNTATWASSSGTVVGNAAYAITATNIAGGNQYDIPFQSAGSSTIFNVDSDFQYHDNEYYLKVTNIQIWGDGTGSGPGDKNNQIVDTNGLGIEVYSYSTGSTQLNWSNTNFITVDGTGVSLTTSNSNTATFNNSGKLTLPGILQTKSTVGAPLINGSTDHITMYGAGSNNWNYAQGIEDNYMWFQVGNSSTGGFKWYASGNEVLRLGYTGILTVKSTVTATSAGAGSLIVDGGIYVAKNIQGGRGFDATQGNKGADLVLTGGAYLEGNSWINATTQATSTGTAALSVRGGVYANENLIVKSSLPTFSTSTNGSVSITGGVGIGKDLYVATTATIGGNLYVGGNIYLDGVGLDTVTGTTGTFKNLISTGTITAVNMTATSITATYLTITGSAEIHGIYITQYGATLTNLLVTGTTEVSSLLVTSTLSNYTPGNSATIVNYSIATLGGIKAANDIISGGIVAAGDFSDTAHPTPRGNDSGTVDGFYLMNNMQSARSLKNISGTGTVVIDTWNKSIYTSAKYIVQVVDGSSIHTEEMLIVQDGTTVYMSQYGLVYNNSPLGSFDGSVNGAVEITFTPVGATSMSVQVVRQTILTTTESYG